MVGHAQHDDEAPSAKKARAVDMGVKGMGPRANCFVIMSIPNMQKKAPTRSMWGDATDKGPPVYPSLSGNSWGGSGGDDDDTPVYRSLGAAVGATVGVSRAARVSVDIDNVAGAVEKNEIAIERPETEPIMITILNYNTIEVPDGVENITELTVETADIALAVKDMEWVYGLIKDNGGSVCKLSELPVMLHKMTPEIMTVIKTKLMTDQPTDPFKPVPNALAAFK